MKKILLIYLTVFLVAFSPNLAKKISREQALKVARNWVRSNAELLKPNKDGNFFRVNDIKPLMDSSGDVLLAFVAELFPRGFVIVSPDDEITPVLGFSTESNFNFSETQEDFYLYFLKSDVKLRLKMLEEKTARPEIVERNKKEWLSLLDDKVQKEVQTKDVKEIFGPFLNSTWGQAYVNGEAVFNYYTPHNWPAGCVATAMAQILNYYKWPLRGYGYHSYTDDNTGFHSANFGKTEYDWANTLDDYENVLFTTEQQKAAGLLTYHAAVSVNMDFERDGSTASTGDAPYALRHYFRYSGHYSSVSSSGFWTALKNNMLDARPAILSIKRSDGMGHAAVVDGYAEMNGYYHLNPGWYGNNIGWYDIQGSWNMGGYTIVIGAAKGIVPSPMINDMERIDSLDFYLSWSTSRHQDADFYQLQQARSSGGPWTTLSDHIPDTVYQVHVGSIGSYYYRVRAKRDGIWWDYSTVKKIQLGSDREIVFQVNMNNHPLGEGESVGVRGNIAPLSGITSLGPFEDKDGDGIYKYTVKFDYDDVGKTLIYRFTIDSAGTLKQIESKNREYVITSDIVQILPVVYFDDLNAVSENAQENFDFALEQNFPNPFNPATTISYSIPSSVNNGGKQSVMVSLRVYNLLGQKVSTLVNAEQKPGDYTVRFDASGLPSGIYFYVLTANGIRKTRKMILLK